MNNGSPRTPTSCQKRQFALSQWDGEGGAGPLGPQEAPSATGVLLDTSPPGHAELVQLRIRIIALENLIIAMLADASERQRNRAAEMAAFISPQPGFIPHPLTIRAAAQMNDLAERARVFRSVDG